MKAFSSWFVDTSSESRQYSFYIDGINENLTGIEGMVMLKDERLKMNDGVYDLQGRRVQSSDSQWSDGQMNQLRKGIYIINGKKTIIR